MKVSQFGRSMIEMIGVLAIIGVLSVGAIAGYSKAMLKYKLNRQSAQYNQLLASVYKYYGRWGDFEGIEDMLPILTSLNEIPKKMVYNGQLYDIFHNKIVITFNPKYMAPLISIYINLKEDGDSMEICRNAFVTVKEWHENVYVVESFGVGSENTQNLQMLGDKYCKLGKKCLVNLTINDIDNLCRSQLDKEKFLINIYTADNGKK